MNKRTSLAVSAGLSLGLAPAMALASDFSGMFTLLVGLPSLALANIVMGVLFAVRPSRATRTTLSFIVIPVLVIGLLLFSDAASLLRNPGDTFVVVAFFGLYVLACVLFVLHMQRGAPPPPPPPPGE